METSNKNSVREFVELITQSGLSTLDKEWFLMKFFEDGGLTEEIEKDLLEALEESNDVLQVQKAFENEEVRNAMKKTLKESGLQKKMEKFVKLRLELEANTLKRDKLIEKHQQAADAKWQEMLSKHDGDPYSEEITEEYDAWMKNYRDKHEAEYKKLVEAVEKGREDLDQAEKDMAALVEELRKKQQEEE